MSNKPSNFSQSNSNKDLSKNNSTFHEGHEVSNNYEKVFEEGEEIIIPIIKRRTSYR